jgi:hypothetical protein
MSLGLPQGAPDPAPQRADQVAVAPHDGPVAVSRLHRGHVGLLLAVAVGLVVLTCAAGVLAALVMSDLVQVSWRTVPGDPGVGIALARRLIGT